MLRLLLLMVKSRTDVRERGCRRSTEALVDVTLMGLLDKAGLAKDAIGICLTRLFFFFFFFFGSRVNAQG